MKSIISDSAIQRRMHWIEEIVQISGHFESDSTRVESELSYEICKNGIQALLDHLRLCSSIPESYNHDSSEEKLYSKYTDALIAAAYDAIGLKSLVLTERADAADVEVVGKDYSFVADAKVFRLSRTAKNQKDFKVQAMDGWKRGNLMPWLFALSTNFQHATVKFTNKHLLETCVFFHTHIYLY